MNVTTFHELYVENLRDLFSAETQILSALPKLANAVEDAKLKKAMESHQKETEEHVRRLDKIFKELEEKPTGHTCAAMKGLVEEASELLKTVESGSVLDAAIIGAIQRIEHYEMAGYGTARTFANQMGHSQQAELLQTTLDEEGAADEALTRIAEGVINPRANKTNDASMQASSTKEPVSGSRRS